MQKISKAIVALSMIAGSLVSGALPASATACSSSGSFAGGAGTSGDPYRIATPGQLQHFANAVHATFGTGNSGMVNNKIVLTANIDMASCVYEPFGAGVPFRGTFDGQNFTISNLVVSRPSFSYASMFPATANGATIKNLKLQSPRMNSLSYNGVLIGDGDATNLENIRIDDAVVSGGGSLAGAIAGQLGTQSGKTMDRLVVTNSVISAATNTGGLFGLVVDATITKSAFLEGRVVRNSGDGNADEMGGLVSWVAGTSSISESAFTGSVEIPQSTAVYAGLMVGRVNNGSLAITDSYARGAIKTGPGTVAAGVAAYLTSGTVSIARVYVQGSYYRLSNPASFVHAHPFAPAVASTANSFYDSEIHVVWAPTGGGTAKTSAELGTADTFTSASWTLTQDTSAVRAVSAPTEKWFLNSQLGSGYPVHTWAYRAAVYANPCPAGSYSVDGLLPCVNSSPGNHVPASGATAQLACPPGSFQPDHGANTCLPAQPGFYVADAGASEQLACAAGTTSGAQATACEAIPPYSGPLVTSTGVIATVGETVSLSGSSLSSVSSASVQGQVVEVISRSESSITLKLPESIGLGLKDLVLTSDFGVVTIQGALRLVDTNFVTVTATKTSVKRIGDRVRIYADNLVGAGKVQFKINGREIGWVRAVDATDPKLRSANGASYFVRSSALAAGKNEVEIYLGNALVKRVVFTKR